MNIFPRLQETVEPGFAGRRGWILPQETLGATAKRREWANDPLANYQQSQQPPATHPFPT